MAMWNAPERLYGHEKEAVTAALAMQSGEGQGWRLTEELQTPQTPLKFLGIFAAYICVPFPPPTGLFNVRGSFREVWLSPGLGEGCCNLVLVVNIIHLFFSERA